MPKREKDLFDLGRALDGDFRRKEFTQIIDELLFHAALRFNRYQPFPSEGSFVCRLQAWLNNVSSNNDKRTLLRLADHLTYIDERQMRSLYRDAFRRVILPWASWNEIDEQVFFDHDYDSKVKRVVQKFRFYSITESFSFVNFKTLNELQGIRRPCALGPENLSAIPSLLPKNTDRWKGLIILEDFIGSGEQAMRALLRVREALPRIPILFVPLLILPTGLSNLKKHSGLATIKTEPVYTFAEFAAIALRSQDGEPAWFKQVRNLIETTKARVMEPDPDDCENCKSVYGHADSGAMVIKHDNTPNNSLPLIHRRAPQWRPLFRRTQQGYPLQQQ